MARRLAAPLALCLIACADDETAVGPQPLPGPEEWNRDVAPPSDGDAAADRLACTFEKGALPAETQGSSYPNGSEIPVDHVLVMMMENRSFDHYFQKLPEYGQPDADVAPDEFTNPDPDGVEVGIFHDTDYCFPDTAHGWSPSHTQVNGGAMDGFFLTNEGHSEVPVHGTLDMLSGRRALGYYDETDLPFYYWLANEFSIADRYFCSLQGPTLPNRAYLYAATSLGYVDNTIYPSVDLILDYLDMRQVNWAIYKAGAPGVAVFASKYIDYQQAGRIKSIDQFYADAAAGTLPQFAFVDPNIGIDSGTYDNNDEHPPAMAPIGQKFAAEVVDALTKSPNWPRSALFITYDEHGGLYDHVEPPKACKPDDLEPMLEPGQTEAAFDEYGIRVPMIVVSPFAKKHHVSHEVYDHTSIVRFIEARFVMPALTGRDANALAPWDMFDFDAAPHLSPPAVTVPSVPQDALDECTALFER